jgi:hypothetical protein
MTPVPSCGNCAFWKRHGEHDGTCRHNAPRPTDAPDEITHWPMTAERDRCADGVPLGSESLVLVTCGECQYWHTHPTGGLDPQNRRDARRDWWDTAGHCLRHAPEPSSDPGCRGFWRATNFNDSCGQGIKG